MELLFGIGLLAAAGYVGFQTGVRYTIDQQNRLRRNHRRRR